MAAPILELKHVHKSFGKHQVLRNITVNIDQGDIFGIIGGSGCGKTTLLNILIGYYRPSGGELIFNKQQHRDTIELIHKVFGFASQAGSFYPTLTVSENLHFFGRMYNMEHDKIDMRIGDLLKLMGLQDARNKIAEQLSTGMQRRLDISCALIHHPSVLILDEPTEDLDPILRKDILALIRKINREEQTTIIITSHMLGEIEDICNRVAILHEGQFIQIGTPLQIKENYSKNQEVHVTLRSGDYEKLLKKLHQQHIARVVKTPHDLILYSPQGELLLKMIMVAAVELKDEIVEISLGKPTLEEVFEALTHRRRYLR